jgi:hypothetical protein
VSCHAGKNQRGDGLFPLQVPTLGFQNERWRRGARYAGIRGSFQESDGVVPPIPWTTRAELGGGVQMSQHQLLEANFSLRLCHAQASYLHRYDPHKQHRIPRPSGQ